MRKKMNGILALIRRTLTLVCGKAIARLRRSTSVHFLIPVRIADDKLQSSAEGDFADFEASSSDKKGFDDSVGSTKQNLTPAE